MRKVKNIIFTNNRYVVRFAQNEDEVKAAQRLRYNVFNIELGEGLQHSQKYKLDADQYDDQCHHLLVFSKETDEVIGTYRMQTYDIARKNRGPYTAKQYNIEQIPQHILNNSIEVGRACIDKAHRNGRVLFLLWRGLAKYLSELEKRYLFGCCSLTSQSPEEAWQVMKYIKSQGYLHDTIYVSTTQPYHCEEVEVNTESIDSTTLPQLFRLYIDLGAKVCSPPALDREFKTIDYLILLDVNELDERSRLLFFK